MNKARILAVAALLAIGSSSFAATSSGQPVMAWDLSVDAQHNCISIDSHAGPLAALHLPPGKYQMDVVSTTAHMNPAYPDDPDPGLTFYNVGYWVEWGDYRPTGSVELGGKSAKFQIHNPAGGDLRAFVWDPICADNWGNVNLRVVQLKAF